MICTFFSFCLFAEGEGSLLVPKALEGTQVEDRVGAKIPMDVKLTDDTGRVVTLSNVFSDKADKRPVILTLGYFECPMLCSLVLNGLVESLKDVSLKLGQDYRVMSVSIAPDDTYEVAKAKRENYLQSLQIKNAQAPWHFYVGDAAETKKLADAVGFGYKKDKSGEIAHGAAIFFISPEGVLTRTLWGISFKPPDVSKALIESSEGKVGSPIARILLSCFHYNPDSRTYGVYIFGVMRLAGLVTVIIVAGMLFIYWRIEKKRRMKFVS